MTDPTIWGMQKEFAWDAFQKAFDAGKLEPSRFAFDKWWDEVATHDKWEELHDLMEAAWLAGVLHRNQVNTSLFNAYWQNGPLLSVSQEKMMWTCWQVAFDAGRLLPDHAAFEEWWALAQKIEWLELHEMFEAAWGSGVQDRCAQCSAGFNDWWQEILDHQPVVGHTPDAK